MVSSVGGASAATQAVAVQAPNPQQVARAGKDRDGDNDGSKVANEVEKAASANKPPVSATVGNNVNTTA